MKSLIVWMATWFVLCTAGWYGYLNVPPPGPILTSVTPNSIVAGSQDTGLSLLGSNFKSNAQAILNQRQALNTSYISSTSLRAVVPAANLVTPGTASVAVAQSTGSNQSASKSLTITINPSPVPTLTSISPAHVILGTPAFTMTLTGTNFTSSSVATWDTTALTTTFVSATSLTAAVPITLYTSAGTSQITVKSGTATSNAVAITKIAQLIITTTSIPAGTVGAGFTWALTATGGTLPYTWSTGTLPAGLTLNASTGVISGIPTTAGTTTVTATVTDSTGTIAKRTFRFDKAVNAK